MSYHAILGHDRVIAALAHAFESGRVAHAYLFTGPDGVGKRTTALEFAKALNCGAPVAWGPCDECVSCRKIAAGSHPDVRVVTAAEDKTAIGIDQVRSVLKDAALRPYEGSRKVFIIDAAGEMKHEAQSIFLKSLEEPARDTVFIMISRRAEDLFPTIVSRSVVVAFRPLAAEHLRSILTARHRSDAARAHIIAAIASGSAGEAVRYATDEKFFDRRSAVIDGLIEGTYFDAGAEKPSKELLRRDLDIMMTWFRDLLVARVGHESFINVDRRESIAREAKRYAPERLGAIIRAILDAGYHLEANVNAKLAMGVLGMELQRS